RFDKRLPFALRRTIDEVGDVEDDFDTIALQRFEQTARGGGAVDDVAMLWLDADGDAMARGDRQDQGELVEQRLPGRRAVIVGMRPPLILGIAAAGTDGEQGGAHRRRRGGDRLEGPAAGG